MVDLNKSLSILIKTGKVTLGAKNTLDSVMMGKVKIIVAASNCPEDILNNIERLYKISNVSIISYPGNSLELGRVCGKPFLVSLLAIRDAGDSDINKFTVKDDV